MRALAMIDVKPLNAYAPAPCVSHSWGVKAGDNHCNLHTGRRSVTAPRVSTGQAVGHLAGVASRQGNCSQKPGEATCLEDGVAEHVEDDDEYDAYEDRR